MFSGAFKIKIQRERERERGESCAYETENSLEFLITFAKKTKRVPKSEKSTHKSGSVQCWASEIKFLGYGYNCHDLRLL
jgi:hypothetical protein